MTMMVVMANQVTSLYVEDPSSTRIMQWNNISNTDGKSSQAKYRVVQK